MMQLIISVQNRTDLAPPPPKGVVSLLLLLACPVVCY